MHRYASCIVRIIIRASEYYRIYNKNSPLFFNVQPNSLETSSLARKMDSVLISRFFRRLFSHQICSRLRSNSTRQLKLPIKHVRLYQKMSTEKQNDKGIGPDSLWQQRTFNFPSDKTKDFEKYPMVTSDALRTRKERPTRVKMLTRDFIDGIFWKSKG